MKEKKRKKIRFFNRPIKLGIGVAGVGASLELGTADISQLIGEPKLIFALEMAKYLCYALSIIFAGSGVVKQGKEDLESIKIGEELKKGAKDVIELEESEGDTFAKEVEKKAEVTHDLFERVKKIIKNRKQ